MRELIEVSINDIVAGDHEQRFSYDEDEMCELSASIGRIGLLDPLGVRRDGDRVLLVYGHRRLQACRRIGMERVPCFIVAADEAIAAESTFAENFFRSNLSPIEQSAAITREFESGRMTVDQLAAGFRRSKDWVARQMAVCHWPEEVLEAIHSGKLSVAAAANLALIEEPEYRMYLINYACDNGATARTTAAWLASWRAMLPPSEAAGAEPLPAGQSLSPLCPQGPCLKCGEVFRVDEMSHVPLCVDCIRIINQGRGRRV